jgi:ABC-type transport system substrate-binding protein
MDRYRTRPPVGVAFLTSLVLVVGACAPSAQQSASPAGSTAASPTAAASAQPTPATTPSGGGTLSIAVSSDIKTLDPAIGYDTNALPAQRLIFESLVDYDDKTTLVPGLAEALPAISDDGLVYTFKLRPGIKFVKGDGTVLRDVAAKDVVASLNRSLDPKLKPTPNPVAGAFYSVIKGAPDVIAGKAKEATGIKALDDQTVEITLDHASGSFLNIMAMTFAAVVPTELAGQDTNAFSAAPVGTGPYLLKEVQKGQVYKYVKNPAYWDPSKQLVDEVEYRVNVDANTQLQQVQTGELDVMGNDITQGQWEAVSQDPTWKPQVNITPLVETDFLWLNTAWTASPTSKLAVRQAIAHALDRANIQKISGDRYKATNQIFPPVMPGYEPGLDLFPYDPDKAKQMLVDAGYPNGFDTKLYTFEGDLSKGITESLQQDLAKIGVRAQIVVQPFDVLLATAFKKDTAEMVYVGWFEDYPDPSDFIDPMFTCATAIDGGSNAAFFCDKALDAKGDAARGERDPEKRVEMYSQLQRDILQQVPAVPLNNESKAILVTPRTTPFAIHPVWLYDLKRYGLSS